MAGANGKFDVCIQNPPYGDKLTTNLDLKFVDKVNQIAEKQVVIVPATQFIAKNSLGMDNIGGGHLKEVEIVDAEKVFNISTVWKYGGIFYYDNTKDYKDIEFIDINNNKTMIDHTDYDARYNIYYNIRFDNDLVSVVNRFSKLRDNLTDKYNTMVDDGHSYIYEENKNSSINRFKTKKSTTKKENNINLHKVKEYLKTGQYKYCLYKGSFNNQYAKVQEWKGQNPDELFKGQICWLTNKENVKNNIKYWLECPLCDMWRRYYFGKDGGPANYGRYGLLPALDFEMSESAFKKYVDSLNDFTQDEIKTLKDNNIHNADKL